ncbi:MAG: hypothetical protein H0V01_13640 [Bacteroidetes bacterium]|nr:hypothetical protein [Bacteroidota bacterium]HET6245437.1 hypothetical protein [Bacteroidia bacterium]
MKKIYYLKTCSTCIKIIKELNLANSFVLEDIKTKKLSETELDFLASKAGSYEGLFNKRARKLSDLKNQVFNEQVYRELILKEYSFLKRPVFLIDDEVFAGNSKSVIETIKKQLNN